MIPKWFTEAVGIRPEHRNVVVDQANIHYLHWPNPGKPGLVFVHGHAAHAHWWDFVAPSFCDRYDIIAPDSSGSGDSDHRDVYSAGLFAREIIACGRDAGHETMTIVGHSFGGSMTRIAAHLFPESIDGIVLIDSALPTQPGSRTPPPMPRAREHYYETAEDGMRRFRLRPPQPAPADYIRDYIARHSLKETAQGYCFKLDSAVFAKMTTSESYPAAADMVRSLAMPVGFIYGENSRFFTPPDSRALDQIIETNLLFPVENAWHHVFLDQPSVFIRDLNELLKRLELASRCND